MESTTLRRALVMGLSVTLLLAGSVPAGGTTSDTQTATLVVDGEADGDAEYATIQAAVDAATPGDQIEVRPGVYREQIILTKSVALIGVGDVTLNGSEFESFDNTAIRISEDAATAPLVAGFTVESYDVGVNATKTAGDWTVRDTTFRSNFVGIAARNASGQWTVAESSFEQQVVGVSARNTAAAWTVQRTTFTNNFIALGAVNSSSDWQIEDTTFDANIGALGAINSTGDWQLDNVSVVNASGLGLSARGATGAWEIRDSTFRNITYAGSNVSFEQPQANGTAIVATDTEGAWTVANSTIVEVDNAGILADRAAVTGDATGNWWGNTDGPAPGDCVGNVDCSGALSAPPGRDDTSLPAGVAQFDENGDGAISPAEAQAAIVALNRGEIGPSTAQEVIVALNS